MEGRRILRAAFAPLVSETGVEPGEQRITLTLCSRGRLVRVRDRTIFAHAVLEFGGCRWVGRQPPCVREDRKMESKGGVYLALDFIIRYPSKGVFDI